MIMSSILHFFRFWQNLLCRTHWHE